MSLEVVLQRARMRLASQEKSVHDTAIALQVAIESKLIYVQRSLTPVLERQKAAVLMTGKVISELESALGSAKKR